MLKRYSTHVMYKLKIKNVSDQRRIQDVCDRKRRTGKWPTKYQGWRSYRSGRVVPWFLVPVYSAGKLLI